MKRAIIIGVVILVVGLLTAIAIPAFAQDPPTQQPAQGQEVWQKMYNACSNGDWEAMAKAAQEFHEELGYPACHSFDNSQPGATNQTTPGTWRGMMGGRGGGWGGMMGW